MTVNTDILTLSHLSIQNDAVRSTFVKTLAFSKIFVAYSLLTSLDIALSFAGAMLKQAVLSLLLCVAVVAQGKQVYTLWSSDTYNQYFSIAFDPTGQYLFYGNYVHNATDGFPLWSTEKIGDFVFRGDRLFTTNNTHILSLRIQDGSVIWAFQYPQQQQSYSFMSLDESKLSTNVFVSICTSPSSPSGDGNNTLYVFSLDSDSGKLSWEWKSPLIAEGNVLTALGVGYGYVAVTTTAQWWSSVVFTFDSATGKLLWKSDSGCGAGARTDYPPVIGNSNYLVFQNNVGDQDPAVYSFCVVEVATGKEVWQSKDQIAGSQENIRVFNNFAKYPNGLVIAMSNRPEGGINTNLPSDLRAFDLKTGKIFWQHDVMGKYATAMDDNGLIYMANCPLNVFDGQTGKIVFNWTFSTDAECNLDFEELAVGVTPNGVQLAITTTSFWPDQVPGGIFVGSLNRPRHRVYNATEVWASPIGGAAAEQVFEPLQIGGYVFACGYSGVTAIDAQTGATMWEYQTTVEESYALASIVKAGNNSVAVPYNSKDVIAFDQQSGAILWKVHFPYIDLNDYSALIVWTIMDGDILIVQSDRGFTNVTAIDGTSGEIVWELANYSVAFVPDTTGDVVYIQHIDTGKIRGISGKTKQAFWTCDNLFCTTATSFMMAPGDSSAFYVTTSSAFSTITLSAISVSDFKWIWNISSGGPVMQGIGFSDKYVLFSGENAYYLCDRVTGLQDRWYDGAGLYGAQNALLGQDAVYVPGPNGIQAIDIVTNEEQWSVQHIAASQQPSFGSTQDTIFLMGNTNLHMLKIHSHDEAIT